MDILSQYIDWVNQIRGMVGKWGLVRVSGRYRSVIIAGMGGSGIVGDYVARLTEVYGGLPVLVYKSHLPPAFISDDDLVIVISYSGNTRETIIFLKNASQRARDIVLVSSDGLLEEYSIREKYLFIKVPGGMVPRVSLPSMLVSILGLLDSSGYTVVTRDTVLDAASFLEREISSLKSEAGRLAGFIEDNKGLPILASHYPYDVLVIRGKNEFNENSKIPVKVEVAPEWMHNDIVGWEKPYENKYSAILVVDPGDRVGSALVDYMERVYERLDIPVFRVILKGSNYFEKLLYGSLLFGLASVELARLRGVDPLKTSSIAEYKEVAQNIFGL